MQVQLHFETVLDKILIFYRESERTKKQIFFSVIRNLQLIIHGNQILIPG